MYGVRENKIFCYFHIFMQLLHKYKTLLRIYLHNISLRTVFGVSLSLKNGGADLTAFFILKLEVFFHMAYRTRSRALRLEMCDLFPQTAVAADVVINHLFVDSTDFSVTIHISNIKFVSRELF